ncbi:MAG: winged helix DNA-binding domain-containing protein [Coriobacteriia bacterium]
MDEEAGEFTSSETGLEQMVAEQRSANPSSTQYTGIGNLSTMLDLSAEEIIAWLLASNESYAAWATRIRVLGEGVSDGYAVAARALVLADPAVRALAETLPAWGSSVEVGGHHSPAYLPNRLNLLADMGVRAGDFPAVDARLDELLEHQDSAGRFLSFGKAPGQPEPAWGTLLCDTNVITDVLLRFGRGDDSRVAKALKRIRTDASRTPQGRAWQCIPDAGSKWRGPGRKADVCPQVTLEGLRALSHLPESERPAWLIESARTPLEVWRRRGIERPYMFGHGYQFKSVKWPNFWYDVLWVLETVGRYPALWQGPDSRDEDRCAVAELAACLIAYNFDDTGRVTPARTYKGFSEFSFGRKKGPSPFATAQCLAALARLGDLAGEIARVDVASLPGSLGGTGTPVPPRTGASARGRKESKACPIPASEPNVSMHRAAAHVLARQHLYARGEGASIESVVADLVGLHNTVQTTPYVSLFSRLPGFAKDDLDSALYDRRSLVRFRCMRGTVFTIRREMLPTVFAATSFPVIRHARRYAEFRGVTREAYADLSPRILAILAEEPLPTATIRERLGSHAQGDIAAAVNLMCTEGLLLRDRPVGSWLDRRATYTPLQHALPDVRLESVREDDAVRALVLAYVRGFGPVTVKDVSWWLAIGKQRVKRALEQLEGEIAHIRLEDAQEDHLLHAADMDELHTASWGGEPHIALLPAMDPLPMGYASRGRIVADQDAPYVFDKSRNMPPTVFVDGRIAGVWDTSAAGQGPEILLHLFDGASTEARERAEAMAAGMGRFWFDTGVPVRYVPSMIPLIDRTAGSVTKPLRP